MTEALETDEGGAFAREILDALEAELVRFRHRVRFDHGVELDRARAAMVLLGKLVGAGVPWKARPDSDPARIHEAFSSIVARDPKGSTTLKREVAAFFAATADVEVLPDDDAKTPYVLLRRAGADPALWWWSAPFAEPAQCWIACGADVERLVQVALALGVSRDAVARSLASAIGTLMTRVKTRLVAPRDEIMRAVEQIAERGATGLEDAALVGAITKLAFEMTAATYMKQMRGDPLGEVAVHVFQLVDALKVKDADVERLGAISGRMDRMFASRGMQLAGLLRKDLDASVEEAIARMLHA